MEIEADDYLAYCFQHEIDHLDGIVFLNRMSRMKASMVRQDMRVYVSGLRTAGHELLCFLLLDCMLQAMSLCSWIARSGAWAFMYLAFA